ncbi:PrsW family intramembrane metalloprotease [Vitiosangium sp. GDMCC 1.1324]|uniref:PrsW family intramembrane metalloprotease n=1 Tax=Vitiosangium sp. (strain GDMCC 1.1324) TaxID=2138576 RepID=UPI000D366907|nr:PrsW family glutamic-type intramembrane protease [Vitiosangium sp. GDMCC 1.1324]PTL75161.1 hypothetical protein DAT35_56205 [Vitiosangium sp. GDMCC 1.1324]
MERILLWGSALIPSLVVLWYVYAYDQFPEPRALRVRTFFLGFCLCPLAILLSVPLHAQSLRLATGLWSTAWWSTLLLLAIPLEVCKFLLLSLYVRSKPAFNEPLDGVVYGTTASLGFAMFENLFIATLDSPSLAMPRMVLSVMGQAACGMVMGACVGRAHFTSDGAQRRKLMATGLGSAILLHVLVVTPLATRSVRACFLALPVSCLGLYWGRKLFMALRNEQTRLFHVLEHQARALATGDTGPEMAPEVEWAGVPRQPPLERTYWAWVKLGLGGLGLCFCGLLWYFTISGIHEQRPTLNADGYISWALFALVVNMPPTWVCFRVFRSGLREPLVASPVS